MSSESMDKSRTQLKKEAAARQQMGERLIALSDEQRQRMDLPVALIEAIADIQAMRTHGARRRQLQYIGSLMRQVDVGPIQQALLEIEQGNHLKAMEFHRIESWRDRLVAGEDEAYLEILHAFPGVDRQRLGNLVRSARKERQTGTTPKSARHLFRYLKTLADEK